MENNKWNKEKNLIGTQKRTENIPLLGKPMDLNLPL
jgi:hypothetical protein